MMIASGLIGTTLTSGMIVGGICAYSASAAQTDDEDDYPTLAEQALTPDTALIAGEEAMPLADTALPFTVEDNGRVTADLRLNPTAISGNNAQALLMGSNSTLLGTITLLNASWFQRLENSTGNAYIESDIDAGGYKIRMWSDGFIFRGGSLTNLGEIEVLGPNNHAYIEQNITPDNMANHSTTFRSVATQGNGGHLHLSGTVSGFSEIYVSAYGSGGHLHIDGTLLLDSDTLNKTGNGTLYIEGNISEVSNFNVTDGKVFIQSSTALVGSGEIVKNGDGGLALMTDIAHTGTLTINGGTVYWSNDGSKNPQDTDSNTLGFSEITINSDAAFLINHAAADQSSTSFTLNGGTLIMNDMSPNGLVFIAFDELKLTADSSMTFENNGALSFNVLTGRGTLTLEKKRGGNEVSELFFEDVNNFNGSIVWLNENNHDKLPLRINTISQDAGNNLTIGDETNTFDVKSDAFYMSGAGSVTINGTLTTGEGMEVTGSGSLTITGDVTATGGFSKFGSGSLTIGGDLTSNGSFYMRHEGTLSIAGGINLEDGTRLFYDTHDGVAWDLVTAENGISASGKLYIYSYEIDESEMKQGFNLGLSSTAIDKGSIFALGYSSDEYEIYEQGGYWYLRADHTPWFDPDSNDGIWDRNWGNNEMANRPLGDMPTANFDAESPNNYLAAGTAYTTTTMEGTAVWAQFTSQSAKVNANIFGGDTIQGKTGNVVSDSWMDVIGGVYNCIVGGNDANSGNRRDFVADSHIQLRKGANEQEGPTVSMVVGGNLRDGAGSSFVGDSYISIAEGATVTGGVVGGSVYTHNNSAVFDGNSHIFIYTVMEKSENPGALASASNAQAIIGGNHIYNNCYYDISFTGDSTIALDLSNAKRGAFGKEIIGGDAIGNTASIAYGGTVTMTHGGGTIISITGANGVTFTEFVMGGSRNFRRVANLDRTRTLSTVVSGDTLVLIDSGTYSNTVIGGSLWDTENATINNATQSSNSNVVVNGGSFKGEVAIVGGNYSMGTGRGQGRAAEDVADPSSSIGGNSGVSLFNATVSGHVVGASALVESANPTEDSHKIGSLVVERQSTVSVVNSTLSGQADIIGGFYIDLPVTEAGADAQVSLGGASVSVLGSASVVGNVYGGSVTNGLNVDGLVVSQGDVEVSLGYGVTVTGDVFAAGVQGGESAISSESTSVTLAAGIRFTKKDGSPTIISGGYLSQDENGNTNAYASYYDNASQVTGNRTLTLTTGEDYKNALSNAYLLNFDEVELQEGAYVSVGALLITDTAGDVAPLADDAPDVPTVTVSGEGTIAMQANIITIPSAQGVTTQSLNNSYISLTDGASFELLASEDGISYLDGLSADQGSEVTLNLMRNDGKNEKVQVWHGITMNEGSTLTLTFDATADMLKKALISEMNGITLGDEAVQGSTPALTVNNGKVELNINSVESSLLNNQRVVLLIAETAEGDFETVFTSGLEKWFTGEVEAKIENINGKNSYVITGVTVSPETANFHKKESATHNGYQGGAMLDNLYTTLNPETTDPNGDRAKMLRSLEQQIISGNTSSIDRTMAAAAGASLPTIGLAFADDLARQQRSIRNRTTTMGADPAYEEDILPTVHCWINAETDFRQMKADDTFAGYKVRACGGTVGVGADISNTTSVGFAISAMYSKFEADAPDSLEGDMTTSYISGFARVMNGKWSHTFIASVGLAKVDATRTVNYGSGSYSVKDSPNGYAAGLMYELGYSIPLYENSAVLQPVMNISWRHTRLKSFRETGSDAALDVSGTKLNSVDISLGLRMQTFIGSEMYNHNSILEGRLLIKAYAGDTRNAVNTQFVGASRAGDIKSAQMGRIGAELGAQLTVPLETVTRYNALFIDASVELRNAYTNFNATVGWKCTF